MNDMQKLAALEAQLEELKFQADESDKNYNEAVDLVNLLSEKLKDARERRNAADEQTKKLKRATAAIEEEAKKVKLEVEMAATNITRDFVNKLDSRAAKFKWNHAIYDYQREDIYRIAYNNKILLGNEMGTGKTISSIASADLTNCRHILILTPAKLAGNFEDELKKWAPHRFVLNLAGENQAVKSINLDVLDILHQQKKPTALIMNYESWINKMHIVQKINSLQFDGVIMDEAHNFKNKTTWAYKGIKDMVSCRNTCIICKGFINQETKRCSKCGWELHSCSMEDLPKTISMRKLVLPMTGTFLVNSPQDIWPALNIILPDVFSEERIFLNVYARQNEEGKWVFKTGGEDRLARQLGSKYIRRTMAETGITLPKQTQRTELISLSGYNEQAQIMQNLKRDAAAIVNENTTVTISEMIALITRQRQAAVDPNTIKFEVDDELTGETDTINLQCERMAKIDYLIDNITRDVLFDGKRVAVFTQFSSVIPGLKKRLEELGLSVLVATGSSTKAEMEKVRHDFDRNYPNHGKYQVVLANFRVGGAGLNFTDVTKTYELDSPWNPAMRNQAKARSNRIGQTQESEYVILELENSIDVWLKSLVEYKQRLIDGFEQAAGGGTSLADMLKATLGKVD